jgi:hypothetical protein
MGASLYSSITVHHTFACCLGHNKDIILIICILGVTGHEQFLPEHLTFGIRGELTGSVCCRDNGDEQCHIDPRRIEGEDLKVVAFLMKVPLGELFGAVVNWLVYALKCCFLPNVFHFILFHFISFHLFILSIQSCI